MRIIMAVLVSLMFTGMAQAKADDDFAFICKSGVALQRGQELDGVVSEISTQFSYLVKTARTSGGDLRYQCFFKKKGAFFFWGERKTITFKAEGTTLTLRGYHLGHEVTRTFEMVTGRDKDSLIIEGFLRVELRSFQKSSGFFPDVEKNIEQASRDFSQGRVKKRFLDDEIIAVFIIGISIIFVLSMFYKKGGWIKVAWREQKELRQWIFGVFLWIFAVPIYLKITDYYGRHISDDEVFFTLSVMFIPSTFACLAKFIYEKYIR